jgi:phytoene synthase
VGLAAIEIFEYTDPRTRKYAVELGVALQLTNILRDVAADAARGRIYLPQQDLARFGVTEAALLAATESGVAPAEVRTLLAFQAARARTHYDLARNLLPAADRKAMTPAEIMGAVYSALLEEIVRRGYPLRGRLRLSRPRKAWIALRTLVRSRRP